MRRVLFATVILIAVAGMATARDAAVAPLSAADVATFMKPPAQGERIIMLWSLDCAYCEPNMQTLAKLQRAYPRQVELVTVATDSVASSDKIAARLHAAGMQGFQARAYAEPTPTRINYMIDPNWGGETPRTIVIHANGSRIAISGELTPTQLRRVLPPQ